MRLYIVEKERQPEKWERRETKKNDQQLFNNAIKMPLKFLCKSFMVEAKWGKIVTKLRANTANNSNPSYPLVSEYEYGGKSENRREMEFHFNASFSSYSSYSSGIDFIQN